MGSEQRWWRVREEYRRGILRWRHPKYCTNNRQYSTNIHKLIRVHFLWLLLRYYVSFGLEDNETDHMLIHKERLYTFPMGIMCGAIVGAANYMSAIRAATYDPLHISD